MPKSGPQGCRNSAKTPFPEPRPRQKRQIETDPQFAPAQGEGAMQPCNEQLQPYQKLTDPGGFPVEGSEHIHRRPQQHTLQKAPRQPLPYNLRSHRRHPRRSRGSS